MPYTANQRVRVYYETEGDGPPLVLYHGLAGSIPTWRDYGYVWALTSGNWRDWGYTESQRPGFRVVLIDARGHGRSDKPYQPEPYRVEAMAGDVVNILDSLGIPKAHFWGYSLGAAVGFALAGQASDRFSSFILGGYGPFGVRTEGERKFTEWFSQAMAVAVERGMGTYASMLEKTWGQIPAPYRDRLRDNDPRALYAMSKTCFRWQGVGQALSKVRVPCLLYAGSADPWYGSVKEGAELLPAAEFVSFTGFDHFSTLYASPMVLPYATRFLHSLVVSANKRPESPGQSAQRAG